MVGPIKKLRPWQYIGLGVLLLITIYLSGPRPASPQIVEALPEVPQDPQEAANYLEAKEAGLSIRPDNEARIIWANDSLRQRTPVSIVYLHGFTASQHEGEPVHVNIAQEMGANLLLTRLHSHGLITPEPLLDFTAEASIKSAQEALALGKALGEKVVLMGTSTGGTLALLLAALHPDDVDALVLYSPNIKINDPNAWLLNDPWGLQVARIVIGSDYRDIEADEIYKRYWNTHYRIESLPELQELIESTMTPEIFQQVKQPVFMGYYYKNESEQDLVVRVDAMKQMFAQLGTPESSKTERAYPETGAHVIISGLLSKDWETVQVETLDFLTNQAELN